MTERFPVITAIEQAVNQKVDSLVGNKDTNLNTIVKMSVLKDSVDRREIHYVLSKMAANNAMEKECIENEFELTYDMGGNLIPVNCIKNGEKEDK